jgi:hypothetical protein
VSVAELSQLARPMLGRTQHATARARRRRGARGGGEAEKGHIEHPHSLTAKGDVYLRMPTELGKATVETAVAKCSCEMVRKKAEKKRKRNKAGRKSAVPRVQPLLRYAPRRPCLSARSAEWTAH